MTARGAVVEVDLTLDEVVHLSDLMRQTGIVEFPNAIRLGLWHLARHLEHGIPPGVFGQRAPAPRRRSRGRP